MAVATWRPSRPSTLDRKFVTGWRRFALSIVCGHRALKPRRAFGGLIAVASDREPHDIPGRKNRLACIEPPDDGVHSWVGVVFDQLRPQPFNASALEGLVWRGIQVARGQRRPGRGLDTSPKNCAAPALRTMNDFRLLTEEIVGMPIRARQFLDTVLPGQVPVAAFNKVGQASRLAPDRFFACGHVGRLIEGRGDSVGVIDTLGAKAQCHGPRGRLWRKQGRPRSRT